MQQGPGKMSQSNAALLQIVTDHASATGGAKHPSVSHFPAVPVRVCLLHMDPLRAAGLQAIFEDYVSMQIVVQESTRDDETAIWRDPTVQVAIVGSRAGKAIAKLIASLRLARPDLHIVVMSPAKGSEAILRILSLGVQGFLHDTAGKGEFEEAVRVVASGCLWAPRRIQAQLVKRLLAERAGSPQGGSSSFTKREQEVLSLLLDGCSNREIARKLKIEERTVKSYVATLMAKTGVTNRTALSMHAISAASMRS